MSIVPHSFLFRHSIAIPEIKEIPHQRGRLLRLPDSTLIPDLTLKNSSPQWGEVKLAWNPGGLGISLKVSQKKHPTTSTEHIKVWIDTRDTKTIHRANRYCHLFQFFPVGNPQDQKQPCCSQLQIHRAQADAPTCDLSKIKLWSKIDTRGYEMDAWLPSTVLNGFDPASYPQLGFYYTISDSESGEQFMSVNNEFPVGQDPSLWATMRLES